VLNLVVILGSVCVASAARAELGGWSTPGFALVMASNAAYALHAAARKRSR